MGSRKTGDKILGVAKLARIVKAAKARGKRVVFTNGCFDLLHVGHVTYLEKAKNLGDILVVGVNSDASIRRLDKGRGRPITGERQRLRVLAALECVDYAVLFSSDTPLRLIERLQPDILVKGADWKRGTIVGADVVKRGGGVVRRIALVKGFSTTRLIERIKRGGRR